MVEAILVKTPGKMCQFTGIAMTSLDVSFLGNFSKVEKKLSKENKNVEKKSPCKEICRYIMATVSGTLPI